jgi:hypothetical protein
MRDFGGRCLVREGVLRPFGDFTLELAAGIREDEFEIDGGAVFFEFLGAQMHAAGVADAAGLGGEIGPVLVAAGGGGLVAGAADVAGGRFGGWIRGEPVVGKADDGVVRHELEQEIVVARGGVGHGGGWVQLSRL